MRTRLLIGAVGIAAGLFGALRFLQLDFPDLLNAVVWLVAGIAVHDAVIAPLTIGLVVLGARVVPQAARVRVTVGLIIVVTVTATAIPVLGRFGAKADNPTILDRNYVVGWGIFVALVVLGTVAAGPVGRLTRRSPGEPRVEAARTARGTGSESAD